MKPPRFPSLGIYLFLSCILIACFRPEQSSNVAALLSSDTVFISGQSEQPSGKYLFVETKGHVEGKTILWAQCPRIEAVMPELKEYAQEYSYADGRLLGYVEVSEGAELQFQELSTANLIGFYGLQFSSGGAVGNASVSRLFPVVTLPYTKTLTILSVDAEGSIIAEIQGKMYSMKPGQSWVSGKVLQEPSRGCRAIFKISITNYGWLNESQVSIKLQE